MWVKFKRTKDCEFLVQHIPGGAVIALGDEVHFETTESHAHMICENYPKNYSLSGPPIVAKMEHSGGAEDKLGGKAAEDKGGGE